MPERKLQKRETRLENMSDNLAQFEDLDVLWSAVYLALEADLSLLNWPGKSQQQLAYVSGLVEGLIEIANEGELV